MMFGIDIPPQGKGVCVFYFEAVDFRCLLINVQLSLYLICVKAEKV